MTMSPNYFRAFVIGTSALVVFPHYFAVSTADKSKLNYTYEQYTFIAPLYYGLMNAISLYLAIVLSLSTRQRYLLIGSLSPLIVISFSYFMKTYTFTDIEWTQYALGLFAKHFLNWNIVVFLLDKFV
jgi:hypothetical protein